MLTTQISPIPPGSQDLLADGVRRRRRVQSAWFALAEEAGYDEVIPPSFEYEEVFTRGAGSRLGSQLLRFVDHDGRLLALRADFTSSIARVAATKLRDAPLPLRLCYSGKVYRQSAAGEGRRRELFQLGAELIGPPGVDADAEIIRLVIQVLRSLDTGQFQLNIGHVGFLKPLLDAVPPAALPALRQAIDVRNRADLLRLTAEASLAPAVSEALLATPDLIGGAEMLGRAHRLSPTAGAREAVGRLEELWELLGAAEREHVVFDLAEIRGMDYYTGIQFELFAAGAGRAIGAGGRYDNLLESYGLERPAIGFALEIDALAELGRAP